MRVFNVAIVGTGFMGPAHTEGLRRLGMNVAGILGSSPEKSRRAAQELGIPKAYGSYAELLADGEIESVHITSPNRHHYAQASEALRGGQARPLREAAGDDLGRVGRALRSGA